MMFTRSSIGNTDMEFKDIEVRITRNDKTGTSYVEITFSAGAYPYIHKHEVHISLVESEAEKVLEELIEGLIIQRELSRHNEVGANG